MEEETHPPHDREMKEKEGDYETAQQVKTLGAKPEFHHMVEE